MARNTNRPPTIPAFRWRHRARALPPLILIGLIAAGCASEVKPLAPLNELTVVNEPDKFSIDAKDLDNVYEILTYTWTTTGTVADIHHDSFVPHGETRLQIYDAVDSLVYDRHLLYGLDGATKAGTPGDWTITVSLYGVVGRVGVDIVKAP